MRRIVKFAGPRISKSAKRRGRFERLGLESLESRVVLDATYHQLSVGPFSQNWTNVGSINADDDWSGVPSIIGYQGDASGSTSNIDPRTILAPRTATVDVIANQGQTFLDNPGAAGGVAEIDGIANPTIALNGSGTADSPFILLHLNTTGLPAANKVRLSYNVRDLDISADSTAAQVVAQYRLNDVDDFTNLDATYIADATTGPNLATQVTPIDLYLPDALKGQATLQIRIMTTNALGNDEAIGIDDISVVNEAPSGAGSFQFAPTGYVVSETGVSAVLTVTRTGGFTGAVDVPYTFANGSTQGASDFTGVNGVVSFADGETQDTITVPIVNDSIQEATEAFTVTLGTPTAGTLGAAAVATVTITDDDLGGWILANGPLQQDWSNTGLITANNNWDSVPSIRGYRGDNLTSSTGVDPRTVLAPGISPTDSPAGVLNVIANQGQTYLDNTGATGGVVEVDGIANPTIALNGSGTADAPFILINLDTTSVSQVQISYNVRDLDSTTDNATMQVALQYRVGLSGDFTDVPAAYIADATDLGTATKVTAISQILPLAVGNQPIVQLRIITTNAPGNDEAIGIDDIVVQQAVVSPGSFQFANSAINVSEPNSGTTTATFTVNRIGGVSGAVSVQYQTIAGGTATAGSDFVAIGTPVTLNWADGDNTPQTFSVTINGDTAVEADETVFVQLLNAVGASIVGGATANGTATILNQDDKAFHNLGGGSLSINWTDTSLIGTNDNWSGYASVSGFLGSVTPDLTIPSDPRFYLTDNASPTTIDVIANQTNPDTLGTGGVAEFEIADPTVALNGSGTADAPHLMFYIDATVATNGVNVSYRLRDLDASTDNAVSQVALQYRVGPTGDFTDVPSAYEDDATAGPSLLGPDILVNATLPAAVNGQSQVYIRILTTNADGSDEWIGVDDIVIAAAGVAGAGTVQFSPVTYSTAEGNAGTTTVNVTVTRTGGSAGAISVPFTVGGTAASGTDFQAINPLSVAFADGDAASKTISVVVIGDTLVESNETVVLTLGAPTGGATLGSNAVATVTITNDDVAASTLQVTAFQGNRSGFVATFNGVIDGTVLNIPSTEIALGASDIVVTSGGNVIPGSVVVNAAGTGITFVATGGALADGSYSVTLRSAADGFKGTGGNLLDGDANNVAGGNYSNSWVLSSVAGTRTVNLPDIVLGPDQATAVPLAVSLDDASLVTALTMTVFYDVARFTPTSITAFPNTPGFSASTNITIPGEIRFSFASTTTNPLPAGPVTLFHFNGTVPAAAAYGGKNVFSSTVSTMVNTTFGQIPRNVDSAVHILAFPGDVSGDGAIDGLDALFMNEFSVGNIDGFSAFQLADPSLIGDLSGDGFVDGLDALVANELAVGNPVPFPIPAIPGSSPSFGGGPDPIISLPRGLILASRGETLVPIELLYTDARSAVLVDADVMIGFDPEMVEIVGVETGTLGSNFGTKWAVDGGTVHVEIDRSNTLLGRRMQQGDSATIAYLVVRPKAGASGEAALNLLERGTVAGRTVDTRLNAGRLTLIPAPTDSPTDTVDGSLVLPTIDAVLESLASDVASFAPKRSTGSTIDALFPVVVGGSTVSGPMEFSVGHKSIRRARSSRIDAR
ncbi:MAG: Calx-beta domain-containing protein [Isosphaeraceae bacterium]|nr:Calx-beta domain-containing protein [Isosphaeraceae bacterium]